MPYPRKPPQDAFHAMFKTALRKGESQRGNRRITVTGDHRIMPTHYSPPRLHLNGIVTCYYYNTAIFGIDFKRKRITDFGYTGYSHSTSQNQCGWRNVFGSGWRSLFEFNIPREAFWEYSDWIPKAYRRTHTSYKEVKVNPLKAAFATRVPWLEKDTGDTWFRWDLFDEHMDSVYTNSTIFLREHQNWRYFTYEWVGEEWTRKFIDADAERRYHARERRWNRGKNADVSNALPGLP